MLAMIIIIAFYVMWDIDCYLILATALWEWGCWFPHVTDAVEAQKD